VTYRLHRREADDSIPLLVVLAVATSPGLLFFSQSVMSEIPYLLFSLLALLSLRTYASSRGGAARSVLTAALIALTILTRFIGLSLLLAAAVYLYGDLGRTRPDCRKAAIVVLVLALIPAAAWVSRNRSVGEPAGAAYWSEFHIDPVLSSRTFGDGVRELGRTASRNAVRYSAHVGRVILFGAPAPSKVLPLLLAMVASIGFLLCAIRRRTAIEYYVCIYMGVLLLYPATHLQRYLVPMMPFIWYYFLVAVRWLLAGVCRTRAGSWVAAERAATALAVLVALLALGNGTAALWHNVLSPRSEQYYRAQGNEEAYARVLPWVRAHTRPDSVFLWAKSSLRFLDSGRESAPLAPAPDAGAELRSILESRADYVVVDAFSELSRRVVRPVVERHPEYFHLVHETDVSKVYQVVRTPPR
jgi:4-amino-4-deoxy-L-arabinose transferase-like glycosyltransferase